MYHCFPKSVTIQRSSHVIHLSKANLKHEFNEAESGFNWWLDTTSRLAHSHVMSRSQSLIFLVPAGQAASKRPQVGMQPELSQMLVNDQPRDSPFITGKLLSLEKVKVVG
ncbi:hypothetical protein PS865_05485 [Pseudomonas fluorescens]|uniref:hypothetical protein n=1 Tax=Pseudomonas fluorescens TaxID=294 RepID=UPI001259D995